METYNQIREFQEHIDHYESEIARLNSEIAAARKREKDGNPYGDEGPVVTRCLRAIKDFNN